MRERRSALSKMHLAPAKISIKTYSSIEVWVSCGSPNVKSSDDSGSFFFFIAEISRKTMYQLKSLMIRSKNLIISEVEIACLFYSKASTMNLKISSLSFTKHYSNCLKTSFSGFSVSRIFSFMRWISYRTNWLIGRLS